MHLKALTLLACALLPLAASCKRPQPLGARFQDASNPPPGSAAPASSMPDTPSAPKVAAHPATRPASALLADYRFQPDAGRRADLLTELPGLPPAEGVSAVGELLLFEQQSPLRVTLFDTLDAFDGQEPAKVEILRRELLDRHAYGEPREAALDALLNIQHRAALPLWQSLLHGGDDATRDVARQAIAALEKL